MASSCRRASARTSIKFAMLAQAISRTAPIAPMSTHNALAMLPTKSSCNGRTAGAIGPIASRKAAGTGASQIGSMRSRSARAAAGVTPSLSRPSI